MRQRHNPRFVETVARRGYRFIAPVSAPVAIQPVKNPGRERRQWRFPIRRRLWLVLAAVPVLIIAAEMIYKRYLEQSRTVSDAVPPPVPLTSYPGFQRSPSFSPDGTRIAFTWDEPGKTSFQHICQADRSHRTRLEAPLHPSYCPLIPKQLTQKMLQRYSSICAYRGHNKSTFSSASFQTTYVPRNSIPEIQLLPSTQPRKEAQQP